MAKGWVRTSNISGEVEERDRKHRHDCPWDSTEGQDAGGQKPQPAAASTVSRGHHWCFHHTRPATSQVGSSPGAAVLRHSVETQAHGPWALLWHGWAAGLSACLLLRLQGRALRLRDSAFHNSGSEDFFVPGFHLGRGLVPVVPLPWAKGNIDPSATAQSHKAQLMLLAVATPRLLPLGFVGAGAFPAIRLPLLVQAANADSLPPADRDVLLHEAGQHACRGGRQTGPRWGAGSAQAGVQPSLFHPQPLSGLLLGL